jgi:hypothetical protein
MKHRVASSLLLLLLCPSCKEAPERPANSAGGPGFWADSRQEIAGSAEFFYNVWDESFTRRLDALPVSGSVPDDKVPYSGHWYPELNGGTNIKLRNVSPLEKYDRAFNGGNPRAVEWERTNHAVAPGDPSAEWAGHCNGWAAAAARHKEPMRAVTRNGVTFEAHDIKALLAEIYMSAKYFFVGGNRCEKTGSPGSPLSRTDPTKMSECEDINPGTFHVALGNWIGRKNHALVADESAGNQVWNYPLYKYSSQIQMVSAAEAQRRIGGTGSAYIFNRNAASFAAVTTSISMAKALSAEPLGNVAPTHEVLQHNLTYILEISSNGEILGGEWTGTSQQSHPDFVWVPLEAVQGNGTRFFGNPHLNVDEVLKLWAESAGVDPGNMPKLLSEPLWIQDWGRLPDFDLVLDGGQSGAVYLGKPTRLTIKRRERLVRNVSVDILLNGTLATALNGSGSADMAAIIEPRVGINDLELQWKRSGVDFETHLVRFHAWP